MGKVLPICILLLLLVSCRQEQVADIELESGLHLSLNIKPMSGLPHEYYRSFSARYGGKEVSKPLLEDMGWWKGTNLYRHISGTYVVHEGKVGCFYITLKPLAIRTDLDISCKKHMIDMPDEGNHFGQKFDYPPSKYYRKMYYIGRFVQADNGTIRFISRDEEEEAELPQLSVPR